MAAEVTATVSENRFTEMHTVLSDEINSGASAITADLNFAYGDSHSACTLEIVYNYKVQ